MKDSRQIHEVKSDLGNVPAAARARGDLYRLTQNIYAAFLLYKTGNAEAGLTGSPLVIGCEEDAGNVRIYYTDSLKNISLEKVESVEVTDDPAETAMFGARGGVCVIKVRLKDDRLQREVTWN